MSKQGASPAESDEENRRAVLQELALIQIQANDIASMQFMQAKVWRVVNMLLGLPAAGVAAIAGGLALSGPSHAQAVGILALTSAVVGSFQTVLGAQRRQMESERSGNSYLEVRNSARRLAELDLRNLSYDQARRRLDEIAMRQEEINRSSSPPSSIAIRRGKRFAEGKLARPLPPA
ncbi:SLATT domain-containing protein [Amycolatopsis sp. NPDC059090]|uniref:SLATT domain-containing protein n=1 Tax=unclassified Amycolatopsis TaxID=2618356 RepID=UPI003672850E